MSEQPPTGDQGRDVWGPGAPQAPAGGAAPWWSEQAQQAQGQPPSPYSPAGRAPVQQPGPPAYPTAPQYGVTAGGQAWPPPMAQGWAGAGQAPGQDWSNAGQGWGGQGWGGQGWGGEGWGGEWPPMAPVAPAARRTPHPHFALRAATTAAVVAGLIGGGIGAAAVAVYNHNHPATVVAGATSSITQIKDTSATADRPPGSIAAVAKQTLASVVTISEDASSGTQGIGSGVVIDGKNGYILTNNHVVADVVSSGGTLMVLPNGGTAASALKATVKGVDPVSDLAVVQVTDHDLPSIPIGVSSDLVVGDGVLAVGAPLGLSGTVTEGIVSALNRTQSVGSESGGADTTLTGAIQTDAAINPGNSGGALVDLKGRLIGINSAIASSGSSTSGQQAGNIGIGFAIPIDTALPTAQQLIANGKATHPYIGVTTSPPAGPGDPVGAKITSTSGSPAVVPNSPADKAGLQEGDVITQFDGMAVTGADDLLGDVRRHAVGDVITLTVLRDGQSMSVKITLANKPS